ncbi:MAG: Hsp70 family protein [Elusimicrobia bacterium]|nr:Hsp70 family protein [Candidatus Obscuribacterium magneticum]
MTNTVKIGIDLGTTNSEVAINIDGKIELVKNIFGDDYTPSVFGVDKAGNKIVGKKSYERLFKDASEREFSNNKAEVKRLMGTSQTVFFERLNKSLSPEEISSEILKCLKEDILRRYPTFPVSAAVITVPAYFSTLQAEATKRAGNLAGFNDVFLLQEPIAAAISYGFMTSRNENWLVYDLGGGTFDVALISSRNGNLTVLSHGGDNFLGGKDIDWMIVDQVITPRLLNEFRLIDFNRGNKKYGAIFSKLKYLSETAKMILSQSQTTTIEIDGIGSDNNGKEIYLNIDFNRAVLNHLIESLVSKTIEISHETIAQGGVKTESIKKVILVGGPTQIPYVRDRIERDLGVEVDSSVDPMTVVAKGACIFALSQQISDSSQQQTNKDPHSKNITIHFEPLSSENEESVSGIVQGLGEQDEFYVQIQSESGAFSGSKIRVKSGKFFDVVTLEENRPNLFWIYLFDSHGNSIPVSPDSFTITHGLSISGAPIPHSIGIAVAKKDAAVANSIAEVFEPFFPRNSILPLKATRTYKTIRRLKKGDTDNILPIKICEGESDIPDRNELICRLSITGEKVPYDLPEGTEVEVTIAINSSREVSVEAFIPSIELTLNTQRTLHAPIISSDQLSSELAVQINRAKELGNVCTANEKEKLDALCQSISAGVRNSDVDEDEKRKADKQIKDLKIVIDQMAKNKELPQLIDEFESKTAQVEKLINEFGNDEEKKKFQEMLEAIRRDGVQAISTKDKRLLARINEQLAGLSMKVLYSHPATWAYHLENLSKDGHNYSNQADAKYFIDKGKRAIEMGDFEELKRCVQNLFQLLPDDEQSLLNQNLSGITH